VNLSRRAALVASAGVLAACEAPRDELAKITGGFTGLAYERGHVLRQAVRSYIGSQVRQVHTLIAGGGVAGLSAARALRLQGQDDFALLELEDAAGGNARGGQIAGIAHPLGAHYLPTPGDDAPEVQDFLEELGIRKRIAGRWAYDEKALCHSPQERLFFNGAWQEGLLPTHGISKETKQQYERFAQLVSQWRQTGLFTLPLRPFLKKKGLLPGINTDVLATKFVAFLDQATLTDPHLRWYLNYCCRDDYGAGIDEVSTFAGLHYFAARHGFHAPGSAVSERDAVLTWPQGNAFLTQALAAPLKERLHTGQVIVRIEESKSGVTVDSLDMATQQVQRWQCARCIVALPLHVAARVVINPPAFLPEAAKQIVHSSWWVANIHLDAPLHDDGQGMHPAWDNVIYGSTGLGYVDAMHQSTRTLPGPTILTYYKTLGAGLEPRRQLLQAHWTPLRDQALQDIQAAHPDISRRAQRMDITRYGHAMAVPTGLIGHLSAKNGTSPGNNLNSLLLKSEHLKKQYPVMHTPATARLRFAHSDWSGYSVFEEAFTRGLHAAL
jgi:protoporphyrinogen oxidase